MHESFADADAAVGASPGLEHDDIVKLPDGLAPVRVTCIDYGPSQARLQDIGDLDSFLAVHRPDWSTVSRIWK